MSSSFHETRWSQVERSQGTGEEARMALSDLCAAYHRPVYSFIRNWCRDEDQVQDLTQEFFARLLARPALDAEPGSGRFRSYLLGAVKHFLSEMQRAGQTRKRGGGLDILALDALPAADLADPRMLPPDRHFDQQWSCALLDRALASLGSDMAATGKTPLFEALKPWLADTAGHGDQRQAAENLGISETAVRVQVHRMRKRYRELIEAEVTQTLTEGASLAEEMRHLFAALAGR